MRTWSFEEDGYYKAMILVDGQTTGWVKKEDAQFIVDACNAAEAAQEQHCLSCGGLKGAHLGRCQPFEDLFSAMYRETFGVDRPSATPRAPFTQEYAAQEQPMTMAERQTRETGFLVKDL